MISRRKFTSLPSLAAGRSNQPATQTRPRNRAPRSGIVGYGTGTAIRLRQSASAIGFAHFNAPRLALKALKIFLR
jgi:hypothetical protein